MSKDGASRGSGGVLAPVLAIAGACAGGGIGYLVGPTLPVFGRLPLKTVATFGAVMDGAGKALAGGVAERAGAFFWGGVILFAAVGFMVGRSLKR
ncbi:MAG: hypothetical protein H6733_08700 [Alphaproteobacteria bacterium]|nr:hypothetical protein [Alphaproteobacteria bacterium]